MRRARLVALLLALSLPLPALAEELTVSAAASLTNAFKDLGRSFEQRHPGTTVRLNFAASGILLQQMSQGAPVDVFASADQATMDRAASQKLIDAATRRDFAANSLVLVTPLQGGPAIASLQDLATGVVRRIAIGKPATVPVGNYTRQALDAARLWAQLEPKLIQADSVRQVLDYVSRGEVDAGFVYRTDAAIMQDKVRIALTAGGHTPVSYPVAVLAASKHQALAKSFVEFLLSAPGQEVLGRYGFGKP
ncbi:molybdate ABC transporter substrate-binding protein [Pigmentiphaga sp. NML080357]|jgi:molybdate transport system substrate-binding protein|uniref:molybdate ABC transporter substrate-binding protein n=1 Tax=Pigmentiphaga sp. NML080357 TaxID=2008675 RepID=UPI000B41BA2A|nr:molybdate ABC transporter substrate-binding protein [Pigmentiphaga sp. NML080357]OVZ55100.1 molybdate ABC transporter substrate-binding protein [Pigmentiphaga sp. NML080357]